MGKGVNKVIIVGNLGNDPEVRYAASGNAITNITVATRESWKDKQTGQQQERTEWHRVCFFNKLAEIAGEYLRKGSQVYVEGSLRTRKWQDNSGQDRYTTEIVASEMQMLGGKQGGDNQQQPQNAQQYSQQNGYQQPQQHHGQNHQNMQNQQGMNPNGSQPSPHAQQGYQQQPQSNGFDDDIGS